MLAPVSGVVRTGFRRRSYVRGNESSGTGITRRRQRTHADPQSVVGEFASIFTILSREYQSYLIENTCIVQCECAADVNWHAI